MAKRLVQSGVTQIKSRLLRTLPAKETVVEEHPQKCRKVTSVSQLLGTHRSVEDVLSGDLFCIPSEQERQQLVTKFVHRTGTKATEMCVCDACARELSSSETRTVAPEYLPSSHLLMPETFHPAHLLSNGLLLYRDPSTQKSPATVYCECISQLSNGKRPALSLANNMWIGKVPFELKILSLPEIILVSRFLASAYVVKLSPKKRSTKWMPSDQLTSALRGNVASYYLKTEDVAPMVDEGYLPPQSSILAATIAVTFIGQKNVSLRALKTMFTVEHSKVANALRWLIANNQFYHHIQISEGNLQSLPVNGVPDEILSTTKWASEGEFGPGEHEGYVPQHGDIESDEGTDEEEVVSQEAGEQFKHSSMAI
ncbi:hypothetical protein EV368DRAFT_88604 [Lentinula lateritia]|nr:hypothetical protein EV368DRAFT_88604 [Lentinula lateritia]